jgi:hypothetical protein
MGEEMRLKISEERERNGASGPEWKNNREKRLGKWFGVAEV